MRWPQQTTTERFLKYVKHVGECWVWTGKISPNKNKPYPYFKISNGKSGGVSVQAHRVSYELFIGPIPTEEQIDHTCRNMRCVNPKHLEPVTMLENIRRQYNK